MHICRGHTGTVTCLALPGAQNRGQEAEGNDDIHGKRFTNFLFSGNLPCSPPLTFFRLIVRSGSDDGSILLWNLNPPSQRTHHIHGKKKLSAASWNGSLTQSPPSLSTAPSSSLLSDSDVPQIPLLPPPILPLAQLVEGRKSGRPSSRSSLLVLLPLFCASSISNDLSFH
jgi:hypothetical protein